MWSSLNLIEVFEGDESVLQEQKNFTTFFILRFQSEIKFFLIALRNPIYWLCILVHCTAYEQEC